MTDFTIPANDWRFALTMVLVCIPFMVVIVLLQTRSFTLLLRKLGTALSTLLALVRFWEPDVIDNRSTPARPRGRKKRLAAVDGAGGKGGGVDGDGRSALGWWEWWSGRRIREEEVDLGRV